MAALPMGAWADDVVVDEITTWTFEDLSGDITNHTLVKGTGYLRAYPRPSNNNDRQFSIETASGSVNFDGTVIPYTKYAKSTAKMEG